jgi:predicted nucleotidyltransferase
MTKPEISAEATRRLIEFYHPLRIYLFGSEARNEATPDSDLDFLVVLPDDTPEQVFKSGAIYTHLSGLGLPKDVVPLRVSDFDRRAAHVTASLPATVLPRVAIPEIPMNLMVWNVERPY